MKPDIHPQYRPVVFQDTTAGTSFLTRSSINTDETTVWEDGNTYPLARVEISKDSHPFFTGTMQIVDTAGRVERFERRYGRRKGGDDGGNAGDATAEAPAEAAPKEEAAPAPAAEAPKEEAAPAPAEAAPAAEAEAAPAEDTPAEDAAPAAEADGAEGSGDES